MIKYQNEYETYITAKGVGSNDEVGDSVKSYISYLESVSSHLKIPITPETLSCENDISNFSKGLAKTGKLSKKTISNYRSAMRQYANMLKDWNLIEKQSINIKNLKVKELLQLQTSVINELNTRKIVRTQNHPLGDYTEWLVAQGLNLKLSGNSNSGYDAITKDGKKIQIKGRRITPKSRSRQLSVIRKFAEGDFDDLAAVIFDESYNIIDALLIPHHVIGEYASYRKYVNGHILILQGPILNDNRIKCIKSELNLVADN